MGIRAQLIQFSLCMLYDTAWIADRPSRWPGQAIFQVTSDDLKTRVLVIHHRSSVSTVESISIRRPSATAMFIVLDCDGEHFDSLLATTLTDKSLSLHDGEQAEGDARQPGEIPNILYELRKRERLEKDAGRLSSTCRRLSILGC
jgi:hypothetical protein